MLTTPLCRQLGITYPIFSGGLIHDIKPAAQIVHDLVREAEVVIGHLHQG